MIYVDPNRRLEMMIRAKKKSTLLSATDNLRTFGREKVDLQKFWL